MRRLGVLSTSVLSLVLSGASLSVASASPSDPAHVAGSGMVTDLLGSEEPGSSTTPREAKAQAQEALETVQEIFAPKRSRSARSRTSTAAVSGAGDPASADPTLALRELTLTASALNRADRRAALAWNQRPWDDGSLGTQRQCTGNICVHWATATSSQTAGLISSTDLSSSAWAQNTVAPVLSQISAVYSRAGYRQPVPDRPTADSGLAANWGGSAQTDIYLRDLGDQGVYGYCAYDLEDTGRLAFYPTGRGANVPAFCVLDNDFSLNQYRRAYAGETSTDILKATAAHEYFHAVQFAYDTLEDAWFMEATATWAERQVFPAVLDHRQYLPYSQLRFPSTSLDTWNGAGGALQYGNWIFFQYLTDRNPARTGAMPNLVLKMWQYADSLGPDQYSIQAVASALASRGKNFTTVFAQYAAGNRRPAATYAGGAAFAIAPANSTVPVKAKRKRSGAVRVNHLASRTIRFKPKKITKASKKAVIRVNMAKKSYGSVAIVTVFKKNGTQQVKAVKLNKKGDGKVRVLFNTKKVAFVELTLVNANRTYASCSNDRTGFSCGGRPVRDGLKEKWSITA